MRASLPEISAVSWSSFMTGTNAGEHGIFGFTDLKPGSYELCFPSFADLHAPTLWDRLGALGLRSVVLNQPGTYPARAIEGVLVSGFVAVSLTKAVKPLRHLASLRRMDYQIDVDTQRCRNDHDFLLQELHSTLQTRERALDYLWDEEHWDYLQLVITGTDRLYHYLWDAVTTASHPRHQQAMEYHHQIDGLIGRVFERFQSEMGAQGRDYFWMLSDHGFCGIQQEVQLNAWLRQNGYLDFVQPAVGDLGEISVDSRAFALDPGRIYLHRQARYPKGSVIEPQAAALMREIAAALRALCCNGQPVIQEVFESDVIYSGPRTGLGPDLVALSRPGFDLKASLTATDVFSRTELTGMHTYDDAFLLSPRPIEGDVWIGDVADRLLRGLS